MHHYVSRWAETVDGPTTRYDGPPVFDENGSLMLGSGKWKEGQWLAITVKPGPKPESRAEQNRKNAESGRGRPNRGSGPYRDGNPARGRRLSGQ
jgi:hypothetical protein